MAEGRDLDDDCDGDVNKRSRVASGSKKDVVSFLAHAVTDSLAAIVESALTYVCTLLSRPWRE